MVLPITSSWQLKDVLMSQGHTDGSYLTRTEYQTPTHTY